MADIELVIKIPVQVYQKIKETNKVLSGRRSGKTFDNILFNAVDAGTPLPKGHGDLIDRNDLLADSYCIDDWSGDEVNIVDIMTVEMADAIIEADKSEYKSCSNCKYWLLDKNNKNKKCKYCFQMDEWVAESEG